MENDNTLLIAALDARIMELECRIEAITASMKLYADPQELATARGIDAHTLSLMKVRRHNLSQNVPTLAPADENQSNQ